MMNQKSAVVSYILSALKEDGIDYTLGGEVSVKDVLTDTMRKEVREKLCDGFQNLEIQLSESAQDKYLGAENEKKLKSYVSGLLNNWIKKNPEFNSGLGYVPKNPGSRTGQGDEQIKNLRLMLKSITEEEVREEIEQAIKDRLAEIKPESVVEVKAEAIPEHLRKFIK